MGFSMPSDQSTDSGQSDVQPFTRHHRSSEAMSGLALPYGFELQFRLVFAEFRGNEFQDFFNSVMERRDPEFRRVRPWGSHGDRKNDGWSPATRTLFQVYAPSRYKANQLAAKLQNDYDGAIDYWQQYFDTWVFVHNDVDGLSPKLELKMAELNGESTHVTCTSWGREQIRREVAQLSDADLMALLGRPITATDFVEVSAISLQPLFDHLEYSAHRVEDVTHIGPVPVDKIERNALSAAHTHLLTMGETKMSLVGEYLERSSARPTHQSEVSATFKARYDELREGDHNADAIFDRLLSWLTIDRIEAERIVNAVTILAYFFFTCQIFEEEAL